MYQIVRSEPNGKAIRHLDTWHFCLCRMFPVIRLRRAILERTLTGDFTTILTELDAVVKQSVSATLEGSSDFNFSTGRCAVRVYERYSAIGNGRVTMSLTLLEADGQIRLSAITSGGSQAVFFKVNTLGAESFLDTIRDTVERFAPGAH